MESASSCHLGAVVSMLIWFSKLLLSCFGSVPSMCLSGTWAVSDPEVQISVFVMCFGLIFVHT